MKKGVFYYFDKDILYENFLEKFENDLALECIYENLNNLSDNQREIFIRFYFYGEKIKDIANELGISESNAKTTLHRTRKNIKKILKERGYR